MLNNPLSPFSLPECLRWRPEFDLSISEHAEAYTVLTYPAEEKGPLRLRRTPYAVPILNAFQERGVEEVIVCKPAQVAGTEIMFSVIRYYAHQKPCPIQIVMSDEDTAGYMADRLQKTFKASPEFSKLVNEKTFNKSEMTLANGANIYMAWASSVAKLASRPIRVVILDEVDKPGYSVSTQEAGPISLAIERTETFYNRKIGILSTPTVEEGNIWKRLMSCDVIYDWHVPCPHCGQFQPLVWGGGYVSGFVDNQYRDESGKMRTLGRVSWQGGRDATEDQIQAAHYLCGECGKPWTTMQKNLAVEQGKAVARSKPTRKPRRVGFHLWRGYSLLGRSGDFAKLVDDWCRAIKSADRKELQGFINSTLALPFQQTLVAQSAKAVLAARVDLAPQLLPGDTIALTAGIDVQAHGFWFVVRAWAKDYTSWLVHYGYLPTWFDLEEMLFSTRYPMEGSALQVPIWRAAIDTGGGKYSGEIVSRTEETYHWIRKNAKGRGCRVWGVKGMPTLTNSGARLKIGQVMDKTPSGKPLQGGLQLVHLNTADLKDTFFYRLGQASDPGEGAPNQAAYLHREVGNDYIRQITAEEKRRDNKGVESWVQIRADNHFLDCEVYAAACADPAWIGGGVNLLKNFAAPIGTQQPQHIDYQPEPQRGGGSGFGTFKGKWGK